MGDKSAQKTTAGLKRVTTHRFNGFKFIKFLIALPFLPLVGLGYVRLFILSIIMVFAESEEFGDIPMIWRRENLMDGAFDFNCIKFIEEDFDFVPVSGRD